MPVHAIFATAPLFPIETITELSPLWTCVGDTLIFCTAWVEDDFVEIFSEVMIEEGTVFASTNGFVYGLVEDDDVGSMIGASTIEFLKDV